MLSDPNLFLQGNYIARFSVIFGAFIKTQGKLAAIIRCCCFTMISNQFMIQIKCLQLLKDRNGALVSSMPPTSKPVTPCKTRVNQIKEETMLALAE